MVVTFTKHNSSISSTSRGMFEYLNKENEERIDEFYQNAVDNDLDIESIDESKIDVEKNLFFTHDYENNEEQYFNDKEASSMIDNNISSNAKKDQSQFFMLNVAPSKSEIEHLKNIAQLEIEKKFSKEEIEILLDTEEGSKVIQDLKNDLVHQQMREYTKDVMKDYAENFDREVYANPNILPTQIELRKISKDAKEKLKELNILPKSENYSAEFIRIKNELAKEIGKDLSVRKMTEKDLVWFAKIEEKRTYKGNDKWVMQNKQIHKEIKALNPKTDAKEIALLESRLNRDRTTNEIVREGMLKGGDQYHAHIIVSRFDKCPIKSQKISLSPLANHTKGSIGQCNKVGFHRDSFRNRVEKSFDDKFRFQRENTYENYKNRKLSVRIGVSRQVTRQAKGLLQKPLKPIKNELKKTAGLHELKALSLRGTISKELGFRIPLSLPTTPLDAGIKIIRFTIGKLMDASRGY